jgi:hypothetical protein
MGWLVVGQVAVELEMALVVGQEILCEVHHLQKDFVELYGQMSLERLRQCIEQMHWGCLRME